MVFKRNFFTKNNKQKQLSLLLVVLLVGTIGTKLLLGSHAAAPYASILASSGALQSGAVSQTCAGASENNCVMFSAASKGSQPLNTVEPVITGTVATGDTLSTTSGTWSGNPTSYTYQWQDCATDGTGCSSISGATSQQYTVTSSDSGHTLNAIVKASNGSGSSEATAPTVPAIDTFSSDSKIDQNVWTEMNQQGDTSNHEVECYEPSQLGLSANGLGITTQYVASGFTCPSGTPDSNNPLNWLSGAIQMKSVNFTYGTIVVRAKMAGGDGAWPGAWLAGADCQQPTWLTDPAYSCPWPADSSDSGEIDIAEDLGSNGRSTINENVYSNSLSHACTYDTGADLSSEYHDYELDWSPGSLVFKVDGTQTNCGVSNSNVPSHPMFLIIDGAVCTSSSSCGGGTNTSTFPQTTTVAWVHVSH